MTSIVVGPKGLLGWAGDLLVFACIPLILAGCAGPAHTPAKLMQGAAAPPTAAPPGQSLVCVHRPQAHGGRFVKTGVWDDSTFMGALGSGQSLAYVCQPGQHHFVSRSSDQVAVIEAQLLPGKIYDLRVETGGLIPSLQLRAVRPSDKERKLVPEWISSHLWVTRDESAAGYEEKKGGSSEKIIYDFTVGSKKDRLQHLSGSECR